MVLHFLEHMEESVSNEPSRAPQRQEEGEKAKPQQKAPSRKDFAGISSNLDADMRPGKLHGSKVDKESFMKVIAETALANVGLGTIDFDTPLVETGMDSLHGVALRNQLQSLTGRLLPASIIFDYPSQRAIVSHLVQQSEREQMAN